MAELQLCGGIRSVAQSAQLLLNRSVPLLPVQEDSADMTLASREVSVPDALGRVKAEYLEMPGLCLTPRQAQRLWGLDREMCHALLGALVDAKFLNRTRDGAFVRAGSGR
jgi:hypothetical protein